MKKAGHVFIVVMLLAFSMIVVGCKNEANEDEGKKYTYEELNELPAMELYDLFLENGLEVDEDLQKSITKDQLAEVFKTEFDMFVEGHSSLSHMGYMKMAKDTKEIYQKIKK